MPLWAGWRLPFVERSLLALGGRAMAGGCVARAVDLRPMAAFGRISPPLPGVHKGRFSVYLMISGSRDLSEGVNKSRLPDFISVLPFFRGHRDLFPSEAVENEGGVAMGGVFSKTKLLKQVPVSPEKAKKQGNYLVISICRDLWAGLRKYPRPLWQGGDSCPPVWESGASRLPLLRILWHVL